MKTEELAGMVEQYFTNFPNENLSTIALALRINRGQPGDSGQIAKKLARMAPYMPDVATHDGEIVKALRAGMASLALAWNQTGKKHYERICRGTLWCGCCSCNRGHL